MKKGFRFHNWFSPNQYVIFFVSWAKVNNQAMTESSFRRGTSLKAEGWEDNCFFLSIIIIISSKAVFEYGVTAGRYVQFIRKLISLKEELYFTQIISSILFYLLPYFPEKMGRRNQRLFVKITLCHICKAWNMPWPLTSSQKFPKKIDEKFN